MRISKLSSNPLFVLGILVVAVATLLLIGRSLAEPSQCRSLSDADAIDYATRALNQSFGNSRDRTMLGGSGPAQLRSGRPERESFGSSSPLSSTNVPFRDVRTNDAVIIARIFDDCDIEWRPTATAH